MKDNVQWGSSRMPLFSADVRWAIRCPGQTAISNNIGDPDCFRWTVDRIKKTLTENRVEMYREDNNCNAAKLWLHLDTQEGENRTGITECKFIDAHYRMWDEFIACTLSYGGCGFVDSCASGGGRNDLESMRRGIPLLRSDSDRTTSALRLSMTSSFCKWIPFCGALTREKVGELDPQGTCDPYVWRASYLPSLNVETQFVYHPTQDFSMIRFGIREWSKINEYLLKDFYTLTPWHSAQDNFGFTAICYHDEEENKGILLAFRQERCMEEDCNVTLPFVTKEQLCTFTDEDTGETVTISGKEMASNGLTLSFPEARSARLLCYSIT